MTARYIAKMENIRRELLTAEREKKAMEFRKHKKNGFTMVYGFKRSDRYFDMVLTLYRKGRRTRIYGFCSKINMRAIDLLSLWEYLKRNVETDYLEIEALPEHARIYSCFLPVISKKCSMTFDDLDCEILTVKIR